MSCSLFSSPLLCSAVIPLRNSGASYHRVSGKPCLTVFGHSAQHLKNLWECKINKRTTTILSTIGFVIELRALYKVSIKFMSVILWFVHCVNFFFNLCQVSCKALVRSCLKLLISSLNCTLFLEDENNLSRKAPFNCLQLVIKLGVSSFSHNIASPERDNRNNLNRIAFRPTPGLSKDLKWWQNSPDASSGHPQEGHQTTYSDW